MGYHNFLKPRWKQFWFSILSKIIKTKRQREKVTDAYIKAINKYDIKFLTHLNYGVKVNIPRLADECLKKGVLIELNGKRIKFDNSEIEYMKKIGTKFILNSDAHVSRDVGETNLGQNFVIKNNIDVNNVVNLG